MIAKLHGILDETGDDWLIIDVGGVGYKVFATGRMLSGLPAGGAEVVLHIEMHMREDHVHLFGFEDPAEADMFRLLQSVQGVGAKVALGILSVLDPAALASAVALADTAAITQASGVGPKLAARIANELGDKIGKLPAAAAGPGGIRAAASGAAGDAISALVKLGYRAAEAHRAIATAQKAAGEGSDASELIRHGLKELSQ
jgi:Holliday junction DNA helicase RuvA